MVHGYTPMKESTWDKECTPMKESTWDKECTLTKKSTWYKEWTPLLDSLPDPFTNRKVQSKVLDAYLKPVDKMTVTSTTKLKTRLETVPVKTAVRVPRKPCASVDVQSPRSYSPCIQP